MALITQQIIRSENLRRIYHLIDRNANISRANLAGITSLSKTTVSSLVDELIRGGYVVDCGAGVSVHQGRRPNALQVDGDSNVVAVISWRRGRLDIALVSSDSRMVYRGQAPLNAPEEGVEQIRRAFFEVLLPAAGSARIMGVCVIIPGIVDEERQSLFSTVIGVGHDDPVVPQLQQALAGYPLCFLNDTACLGYAERVFTPVRDPYVAYVNVSKGVGAVPVRRGPNAAGRGRSGHPVRPLFHRPGRPAVRLRQPGLPGMPCGRKRPGTAGGGARAGRVRPGRAAAAVQRRGGHDRRGRRKGPGADRRPGAGPGLRHLQPDRPV